MLLLAGVDGGIIYFVGRICSSVFPEKIKIKPFKKIQPTIKK